ncbi:hypothetical protein N7492_009978 [Penicillium capsulatum]|uniref:F-box domain-containing protein n=1 Tax=Penicillium capsulatum TaxID=69766 RepID=A0A9W9HKM4_9EURO|nr:hypothetical protein N7492_009978 [Penicillium capsulatum]KAJ6112487.1 hypothetical protein N7512_007811 [Penicillium capsulatum]
MRFQDLPHEILDCIVSNLPDRDAAHLATQGRALHSICRLPERKRYGSIRILPREESLNFAFEILMEILRRPSLGLLVQRMEYRGVPPWNHGWKMQDAQRELDEDSIHRLRAAIDAAGFGGFWEDRILNMVMQKTTIDRSTPTRYPEARGIHMAQAMTLLLISVSPRLTTMALTQPFVYHQPHWTRREMDYDLIHPLSRFLRRANAQPAEIPFLQNLREVYFINEKKGMADVDRYYREMDLITCMGLFNQLPSMKSVAVDLLWSCTGANHWLQSQKSRISSLKINHACINTEYLSRVMTKCGSLREFQYSTGRRQGHQSDFTFFSRLLLFKILCEHRETLETLDVDVEGHIFDIHQGSMYMEGHERREEEWQLEAEQEDFIRVERTLNPKGIMQTGSLKDFSALKILRLGIRMLLYFARGVGPVSEEQRDFQLVDCLPENLEYLCILGYDKGQSRERDMHIENLMSRFKSGNTRLKEVYGVDETIPSATNIDADLDPDHLWTLKDLGYDSNY